MRTIGNFASLTRKSELDDAAVAALLEKMNLDADGIGKRTETAVAIEQSIEPGTEVPRGTLVTVKFSNTEIPQTP